MYRQQISDFIDKHKEEMIKTLTELVEIPSINAPAEKGMPYGKEIFEALEHSVEIAERLGLKSEIFEDRINIVSIDDNVKKVAILCHLDVVDVNPESWETPPFKPTIHGNMMFGRGVYDNKGAAIAVLYALYAIKQLNIPLKHGVGVYLGTDEECGSSDFKLFLEKKNLPEYVFVPDSHFPVGIAESGLIRILGSSDVFSEKIVSAHCGSQVNIIPDVAEVLLKNISCEEVKKYLADLDGIKHEISEENDMLRVKLFGKSVHSSRPAEGVNAATALLKLIACLDGGVFSELSKLFDFGMFFGEGFGFSKNRLTLSFTVLEYKDGMLTFQTDSRVALSECSKELSDVILSKLPIKASVTLLEEPHNVSEDSFLVKTLMNVYKSHTGRDDKPYSMDGLTYAHNVDGAVVFGAVLPDDGSGGAHTSCERYNINTMLQASKMFADAIIKLVG